MVRDQNLKIILTQTSQGAIDGSSRLHLVAGEKSIYSASYSITLPDSINEVVRESIIIENQDLQKPYTQLTHGEHALSRISK